MKKILKNSKSLKNDGHFRIPHHKISLKQFSNIFENVVYFFLLCWGMEKWLRIFVKKKFKMVILVFFDILKLPHTVISNSEKLTRPSV